MQRKYPPVEGGYFYARSSRPTRMTSTSGIDHQTRRLIRFN